MTLYFFLGLSPAERTAEVFPWTQKSHSVNISLLQKPSIKKSTAKKTRERWALTVYNASHSSPRAAKIPILASTGHGQTSEGERKLKEAGEERRVVTLKTITYLQPLQLIQISEHAWWRLAVFHKRGNIPKSHQLHLYRVGKCRDIWRTATLLCHLNWGRHGGFAADCIQQVSMSLLHYLFFFPSGKSFWTV